MINWGEGVEVGLPGCCSIVDCFLPILVDPILDSSKEEEQEEVHQVEVEDHLEHPKVAFPSYCYCHYYCLPCLLMMLVDNLLLLAKVVWMIRLQLQVVEEEDSSNLDHQRIHSSDLLLPREAASPCACLHHLIPNHCHLVPSLLILQEEVAAVL